MAGFLAVLAITLTVGTTGCGGTEKQRPVTPPPSSTATSTPTAAPASPAPLKLQTKVLGIIGQGRPVALLGGGVSGILDVEPHATQLARTRPAILLQHLSIQYGLDDQPLPAGYSIKTESRALLAALDALKITEPIDLWGHSSGGTIALDFALDHPERVRSLVLSEPPVYWLLDARQRALPEIVEWTKVTGSFSDDVTERDVERFYRALGAIAPGATASAHPKWPIWVKHRRAFRGMRALIEQQDDAARLRAFKPPVLLVRAKDTVPAHRVFNDALIAHLPNARQLELPGPHSAPMMQPDRFVEQLSAFQAAAGTQ